MSFSQAGNDIAPGVRLASFSKGNYDPGRGPVVRVAWYIVSLLLFESGWLPWSGLKSWLLRRFGARVGRRLVIKPQVRIKYPWRLSLGDDVWLGQETWIDNLADVSLENDVCISQRVYLCTGSHDYRRATFDLITRPIAVGRGAWVGAGTVVLGGVTIEAQSVAAAGSVVVGNVPLGTIVAGNPARVVRRRVFESPSADSPPVRR